MKVVKCTVTFYHRLSYFDGDFHSISIINGFDKDGRPVIYMNPGRQNTETSPRQLRHLVWCL